MFQYYNYGVQTNYIYINLSYIFSSLCSDYVTDLTKKQKLCLTVVSILLNIRFGHAQSSVPKSVYRCRKQPVSTPALRPGQMHPTSYQHGKFCMLDEMLDAFERRQILRKMKKEEKNRVG